MSNNRETQSENEQSDDIRCELNKLRLINANNIIVVHRNTNSITGKFDQLKFLVANKIDILVLTETKLDENFPLVYNLGVFSPLGCILNLGVLGHFRVKNKTRKTVKIHKYFEL